VTVAWWGTPNLDDWVAYIDRRSQPKTLVLADHTSEQRVKTLLARLEALPRREIDKFAKG
jgi:hypothetical protein